MGAFAEINHLSNRLANAKTHDEATRIAKRLAKAQGKKAVKADFSKGISGVNEVAGEIGYKNRLKRVQTLAGTVKNRTTASSRQRATNRILANLGMTTGASGTTVDPRKKRKLGTNPSGAPIAR